VTRSRALTQCRTRRGTEAAGGAAPAAGPRAGGAVPSPARRRAPTYARCRPPRPRRPRALVAGPEEEAVAGGVGSCRPSPRPRRRSAARRPRPGSPASAASLTRAASSPPAACRPSTPTGRSRLQPRSSSHLRSRRRLRSTRWNWSPSSRRRCQRRRPPWQWRR
jgi:hypothetical protein